jgi:hypothetical protein
LASDHVGFIGICQSDDYVSVISASALKHVWKGGMTDNGSYVQTILQIPQDIRANINDSNFVGILSRKVVSRGRANLAST